MPTPDRFFACVLVEACLFIYCRVLQSCYGFQFGMSITTHNLVGWATTAHPTTELTFVDSELIGAQSPLSGQNNYNIAG